VRSQLAVGISVTTLQKCDNDAKKLLISYI